MTTPPSFEALIARMNALGEERDESTGALRAQIAALTAEADLKDAPFEVEIAAIRTALQTLMLEAGLPQIKTTRFTFSCLPRIDWDKKGLEVYALENPTVLQFRQEKTQSRLLWK